MKKVIVILFIVLAGSSCKKSNNSSSNFSSTYSVQLTDDPGLYTAVNIDLQAVEVTGSNGSTVMLNTHAGMYNLLNFSNGVDTLIATGTLQVSEVDQVRLILGSNNSVVIGGITYPLSTPSAQQSGLKLQVHQILKPGVEYIVLLDFDASASIVDEGSGNYSLKPVIRTIETAISGSIKGNILPAGTLAIITATSAMSIPYSTYANGSGYFLISGIPLGTYSVTITPALPLHAMTQTNVIVTTGVVTNIGTINL